MNGKHDTPESARTRRADKAPQPPAGRPAPAPGNFWDARFAREGCVWGEEPARSAVYAADLFAAREITRILVPGCAYGRNAQYLAGRGFAVVGIDSSPAAIELARARAGRAPGPEGRGPLSYLRRDALANGEPGGGYDAVYSFSLLHLFLRRDRERLIAEKARLLRPGGLALVVAFSNEDQEFGRGVEVEEGTFDYRGGRPAHFFTQADLRAHFAAWDILKFGVIDEPEDHGEGPHTHPMRYVLARPR